MGNNRVSSHRRRRHRSGREVGLFRFTIVIVAIASACTGDPACVPPADGTLPAATWRGGGSIWLEVSADGSAYAYACGTGADVAQASVKSGHLEWPVEWEQTSAVPGYLEPGTSSGTISGDICGHDAQILFDPVADLHAFRDDTGAAEWCD